MNESEGRVALITGCSSGIGRALAEDPESGVVVVADKESRTGAVVQVMDQCRLAGAANVSLAAKREAES